MTTFVIWMFWIHVLGSVCGLFNSFIRLSWERILSFMLNGAIALWASKVLGWF